MIVTLRDQLDVFVRINVSMQVDSSVVLLNSTFQAYGDVDWAAVGNVNLLLPSFLAFSETKIPMDINKFLNYTNMRCPALVRRGTDSSQLLDWTVDPDYYGYYGCECNAVSVASVQNVLSALSDASIHALLIESFGLVRWASRTSICQPVRRSQSV